MKRLYVFSFSWLDLQEFVLFAGKATCRPKKGGGARAQIHNLIKHIYLLLQVESGSPVAGVLTAGDSIIGIGNSDARNMTHMQAHQMIRASGNVLQLTVVKYV